MNKPKEYVLLEGECAGPTLCPLSCVQAGMVVCIRQLSTSPEIQDRLRELGLGEKQKIKLVSNHSNIICQVCNARLCLSEELADSILVEQLPGERHTA